MNHYQLNLMMKKLGPTANCCAPYSAVGALFMFWVGMMMVKQPFFILGLEDLEKCKGNAFGAMWLFISIFSACLIFFIFESNMQPNCRYIEHAEDHPILPPGMTDYRVNSEVELSGMMESDLREIS